MPPYDLPFLSADAALRAALALSPGRSVVYFTGELARSRHLPAVKAVADVMRRLAEKDRLGVLAQHRRADGRLDYAFTRVNLARLPQVSDLSPHKSRPPRARSAHDDPRARSAHDDRRTALAEVA